MMSDISDPSFFTGDDLSLDFRLIGRPGLVGIWKPVTLCAKARDVIS